MLSTYDRDCIREHRKTINDYSQVVKSIKPWHRKWQPPAHHIRSGNTSPFQKSLQSTKIPTSPEELHSAYGHTGAALAESMAQYLTNASPKSKQRFMEQFNKSTAHDAMLLANDKTFNSATSAKKWVPSQRTNGAYLRKTDVSVGTGRKEQSRTVSRPASSLGLLIPRGNAAISAHHTDMEEGLEEKGTILAFSKGGKLELEASQVSVGGGGGGMARGNILEEATKLRRSIKSSSRPGSCMSGMQSTLGASALVRPTTAMIMMPGARVSPNPNMAYLAAAQKALTQYVITFSLEYSHS